MKTIRVSEMFYSIQGEGARVGTPAVFVRFSGCDLDCSFCDEGGMLGSNPKPRKMTTAEIAEEARELSGHKFPNIILTGGEPAMQLQDRVISDGLNHELRGCRVAIETNGHYRVPMWISWVTLSPKDDVVNSVREPNEIKLLVHRDGSTFGMTIWEVDNRHKSNHTIKYLQPITYEDDEHTKQAESFAMKLVMDELDWRVGQRLHIEMGVK